MEKVMMFVIIVMTVAVMLRLTAAISVVMALIMMMTMLVLLTVRPERRLFCGALWKPVMVIFLVTKEFADLLTKPVNIVVQCSPCSGNCCSIKIRLCFDPGLVPPGMNSFPRAN